MTALTEPEPEVRPAVGASRPGLVAIVHGVLVVALVVPRLHSGSPLWLDEALSVNIARLPLHDLFPALRQDGSPPFYYLLLHVWIACFGTGATAVRALSTVFSLLALVAAFFVGRRLGGAPVARAAVLVVAACPFLVRYATETRMYALVTLLALCGVLAVQRALERPSAARLATVAIVTGLVALTHYWALFFVVGAELLLVLHAFRARWRGAAVRVAVAVPCGAVLFLPWLPSFLYQSAHTGTPWAPAPTWRDATGTVEGWAGQGVFSTLLLVVLAALAVLACRERRGRELLVLGLGTLLLGLVVSRLQGAGYSLRYSSASVVPVLLASALGLADVTRLRPRLEVVAAAVTGGFALAVVLWSSLLGSRTQAADTAALLTAHLKPGDVVVYCPDQLGPAVDRLLPAGTDEVVYPTMGPPQRVDWVDYAQRNAAASPSAFADELAARSNGAIWLVGNNDYLTYGDQCAQLDRQLTRIRGDRRVWQRPGDHYEREFLIGYPAG